MDRRTLVFCTGLLAANLGWIAGCGGASKLAENGGPSDATAEGSQGSTSSGAGSGEGDGGGSSGGGTAEGGGSSGGSSGDGAAAGGDSGVSVGASVLMYHNHINRDGFFVDPAATLTATPTLDTTFQPAISGAIYTSPIYVESGPTSGTFYVATQGNDVYAIDEASGGIVWQQNVGTPAYKPPCGNIAKVGADGGAAATLGITGTPAIDLATGLIVFDAVTGDATGAVATHMIHALNIRTGAPVWSVDVSTVTNGAGLTFSAAPQSQRSAILIVNGVAYVAYGGYYGDCGSYHGWVVGVPLGGTGATGWATQVVKAGIWGVGGPSSDGESIYVTTGNGGEAATDTTWEESEGMFRLAPGPTFAGPTQTTDFFAPANFLYLDTKDLDLSGSEPLVVDAPALTPSALLLGQGKDGWLYLADRANLGGISPEAGTANVGAIHASNGEISNGGAWATVSGTTYVVIRPNGQSYGYDCPGTMAGELVGVKLDPTAPQNMSVVWCAKSGGNGSPIISTTDGNSDPLVWVFGAEGDNTLHSVNLATGAAGPTSAALTLPAGNIAHHFTTPAIVHGRVFVTADSGLYAFKL